MLIYVYVLPCLTAVRAGKSDCGYSCAFSHLMCRMWLRKYTVAECTQYSLLLKVGNVHKHFMTITWSQDVFNFAVLFRNNLYESESYGLLWFSKGSYSLMAFATYIIGQTPFPKFSAVVMLDDLQVMYFDSITRQAVHWAYNDSTNYDEERSDAGVIFRDMYNDMKSQAFSLKEHLNHRWWEHIYVYMLI